LNSSICTAPVSAGTSKVASNLCHSPVPR